MKRIKSTKNSETQILNRLLDLGKQMFAESDVDRILALAMDHIIQVAQAERGLIILFDESGNKIYQTARHLKKKEIQQPKFEISHTIINQVKSTAKAVCLPNAYRDTRYKNSDSVERLKLLSVICLPLLVKDKVFGVLYLDNRSIEGAFLQEACSYARRFADYISLAAHNALERKQLLNRVDALEQELRGRYDFSNIIGHHPTMVRIFKTVSQVTDSDTTVLIQGETGTGKELIARALHYNSARRHKPFVPINCGGIQESLIESELFGHVKGAFTGAIADKIGWFERANGGTIFLDEVSEMTPALQVKLLRILQTGKYSPVGSSEIFHSNARVVAATNKNLAALVKEGKFRDDLFYRLNVIDIALPPLRERKSDIPFLIQHFLQKQVDRKGVASMRLTKGAEKLLLAYDYPGNIRELENIIERAVALAEGDTIEPSHLPATVNPQQRTASQSIHTLTEVKKQAALKAEQDFVIECLRASSDHISNAAKMAGIDVSDFSKIVKKHDIDVGRFKK